MNSCAWSGCILKKYDGELYILSSEKREECATWEICDDFSLPPLFFLLRKFCALLVSGFIIVKSANSAKISDMPSCFLLASDMHHIQGVLIDLNYLPFVSLFHSCALVSKKNIIIIIVFTNNVATFWANTIIIFFFCMHIKLEPIHVLSFIFSLSDFLILTLCTRYQLSLVCVAAKFSLPRAWSLSPFWKTGHALQSRLNVFASANFLICMHYYSSPIC